MANRDHLVWLEQESAEAWKWRRAQEPAEPDLGAADLKGAVLCGDSTAKVVKLESRHHG